MKETGGKWEEMHPRQPMKIELATAARYNDSALPALEWPKF